MPQIKNEILLPPIKKDENSEKANIKETANAKRLKNILMPKSINKTGMDLNKPNYSGMVRKTENSDASGSIIHEDDPNISRILKTTVDEKESSKIESS